MYPPWSSCPPNLLKQNRIKKPSSGMSPGTEFEKELDREQWYRQLLYSLRGGVSSIVVHHGAPTTASPNPACPGGCGLLCRSSASTPKEKSSWHNKHSESATQPACG